jgi:hypothetical protein
MVNNYKKGDLIVLMYLIGNKKFRSTGIVLGISDAILTIGHNFSHTSPIDVTEIPIKDILESKKVIPKEVNSLDDLGI